MMDRLMSSACTCWLLVILASVNGELYPRLEAPNYAGREFIFTFGDNRPTPKPVMFIVPYNTESTVNCSITYYLGNVTHTVQLEVMSDGLLVSAPQDVTILIFDDRSHTTIERKSIHLVAEEEVAVHGFSNAEFSTDALVALPTDVLGLDYVVPSSAHTFDKLRATSLIIVTAACPGKVTTVSYKFPSSAGYYDPISGVWTRSEELRVSLDQFETHSLQSDIDLSGTLVTSDCSIAVASGNKRGSIDGATGDHMIEMIPPISRLGKTFIVTPIFKRTNGDIYRLLGARNSTTCVMKNFNSKTTQEVALNKGQVYVEDMTSQSYAIIECSRPILLTQYSKSATKSVRYGDPFMSLVPAVIQFDSLYTVSSIQVKDTFGEFDHFISILINSNETDKLQVNGEHLWNSTEGKFLERLESSKIDILKNYNIPGIKYTHIVLSVNSGVFVLRHDNPTVTFGVMVYGLKASESYGYPGGLRLTLTDADCKPHALELNDNQNNDCDWLVDEELHDGEDNDGDGRIDEDVAASIQFPVIVLPEDTVTENLWQKTWSSTEITDSEKEFPLTAVVVVFSIASLILLILLVLVFLRRKSNQSERTPANTGGGIPATLMKRHTATRFSIRGVWVGWKNNRAQ